MGRFSHRPKRLSRRSEREKFSIMVMPAAYFCLPVAVAIFLAASLSYLVYGELPQQVLVLGLVILAIPIVLTIYRLIRGHFSASLDEP